MSERAATATRRCAVNPVIGREDEGMEIIPVPLKKRVLIAGDGPGGLYAAYTASVKSILATRDWRSSGKVSCARQRRGNGFSTK